MENKYKSQRCRKYRVHKVHTAAQLLKRERQTEKVEVEMVSMWMPVLR